MVTAIVTTMVKSGQTRAGWIWIDFNVRHSTSALQLLISKHYIQLRSIGDCHHGCDLEFQKIVTIALTA